MAEAIRELVVKMAKENRWGYRRIGGELKKLGYKVGKSTISQILEAHGIGPAPARPSTWKEFLQSHWGAICACDFFTVEVLTLTGLVRYYVFFFIDLKSRRVEIAGIVHQPYGEWMKQVARNLVDPIDGFVRGMTYLIHDRDPLFTDAFIAILQEAGVKSIRLPRKSPHLNCFAERFVLSIKFECLNKLILLGERHLRHAVRQFVEHYLVERPHQGLGNELITLAANDVSDTPANDNMVTGNIECHERLGGLLKHYSRRAA